MDDNLAQKAICEALKGSWQEAIALNKKILDTNPCDVDALNRMARAYAETGRIKMAKTISKRVLSCDPFNKIAYRCLMKWKDLKKDSICSCCPTTFSAFIEEPGKTKIISLINLGPSSVIASLDSGDEVVINPQGNSVSILTLESKYVGRIPDDIGRRLKNLIKGGNAYQATIKSTIPGSVKIFVREIKCSFDQTDLKSF